jgi:tetratricopeptide (TPR) repeat protein
MRLEPIIEKQTHKLVNEAYEYFQKENYIESFKLMGQAWDMIPLPKENYFESFNIAKYIFDDYVTLFKFDEAERWLKEIKKVQAKYPLSWDAGQVEFLEGKLYFEKNELERAKELFIIAMRNSDGRAFLSQPKKYVDLLKKK